MQYIGYAQSLIWKGHLPCETFQEKTWQLPLVKPKDHIKKYDLELDSLNSFDCPSNVGLVTAALQFLAVYIWPNLLQGSKIPTAINEPSDYISHPLPWPAEKIQHGTS